MLRPAVVPSEPSEVVKEEKKKRYAKNVVSTMYNVCMSGKCQSYINVDTFFINLQS